MILAEGMSVSWWCKTSLDSVSPSTTKKLIFIYEQKYVFPQSYSTPGQLLIAFLFFFNLFSNWRKTALHCCVLQYCKTMLCFCHTTTQISQNYTYFTSLLNFPSLSHPTLIDKNTCKYEARRNQKQPAEPPSGK